MFFQNIIITLQQFWMDNGCVLLQPYDMEVGAGTSHPATSLKPLHTNPWKVVYVQPSRRPIDGRYGDNPNRLQHYYQLQVIIKPSPNNLTDLVIESLNSIQLYNNQHDIRFVEDNWENPTLGASGLGWEVWCDGMEIAQVTYMQQLGGLKCNPMIGEITYGLERLALYSQNIDSIWDIKWNAEFSYKDIFHDFEVEQSRYNFEFADINMLKQHFHDHIAEAKKLINHKNIYPAQDQCLKASHIFNLLEARKAFGVAERANYMGEIRHVSKLIADL
jgi:glycyl-tRNA synthetase alpha chain